MTLSRDEAKQYIKQQEPTFLPVAPKKINGHKSYVCPACYSGSGKNGTGLALDPTHTSNGKRYKCFACGLSEDVIGLYALANGYTQQGKEMFDSLYSYYGLDVEEGAGERMEKQNTKTSTAKKAEAKQKEEKAQENKLDYFRECQARVGQTDYFTKRGLPASVIEKYKLGYDPNYNASAFHERWKAVIIPTGENTYIARNTDPNSPNRYDNSKGGRPVYRLAKMAIATQPILIVEGEIDALSIMAVGGEAVALGGAGGKNKLVKYLQEHKVQQPIVLALDNDEAGSRQAEGLAEELEKIQGVKYCTYNLYKDIKNGAGKECKDANEALNTDKEALAKAIATVQGGIDKIIFEQAKNKYLGENAVGGYIDEFINGIADSVNTPSITTGFKKLDKVLDGGLYEGLYTVGAISSLGKTTFVLQIADQVAQAGGDVLIFSLEMARTELMAKSISRHTAQLTLASGGDMRHAKTARGITDGKRYFNNEATGARGYSKEELALIDSAIDKYREYAGNHIFITQGLGDVGVETIRKKALDHVKYTGKKPVIIVDYLQILAPYDRKATDKSNTDKAVLELKRLSRDLKTPVIAISSFNRENYKNAVGMEAFKESGAIEYSSDVLIGLQLEGAGQKDFDATKAKKANPRKIEAIILKNRNGAVGDTVKYSYYPLFNLYEETGAEKQTKDEGWTTLATTQK